MKKKSKYERGKEGINLHRIEKYVTASDDWYPCFPDNKVRVCMFLTNVKDSKFVRICVWGADDYGMELDYIGSDYEELLYNYNRIKEYIYDRIPDVVNKEWFLEHAFYQA